MSILCYYELCLPWMMDIELGQCLNTTGSIMIDITGKQLGAYKVEGLIGRGGMASVYKAYHQSTSRNVAIKVMLPDIALDSNFRQRFEREAKTLAGLQHAHILPVFDYGRFENANYLVMPFLPGKTLANKIEGNKLELDEIAPILRQLAGALDYAHSKGILHRDLKPENVMLDEGGNVLLADFGLTKFLDDSKVTSKLTTDSSVMGTPAYMSPEQGQGLPLDHRSDLYSLTVILYEMLTRNIPFNAETPVAIIFKHVADTLPLPSIHRPEIPDTVDSVVVKGMAKQPQDRFNSALEIADAFERAINGLSLDKVINASMLMGDDGESLESRPTLLPTPDNDTVIVDSSETDISNQNSENNDKTKVKNHSNISRKAMILTRLMPMLIVGLGIVFGIFFITSNNSVNLPDFSFPAHREGIISLDIDKNGELLITGSEDDSAKVWSLVTGQELFNLEAHSGDVIDVGIRPDGEEFFTSGTDSRSYTWDSETGETLIQNFEGSPIRKLIYSKDNLLNALIVGDTLRIQFVSDVEAEVAKREEFGHLPMFGTFPVEIPNPNGAQYTALAFVPNVEEYDELDDGRTVLRYTLLTGDNDGNVIRWRIVRENYYESQAQLPENVRAYNEAMASYDDDDTSNDIPVTEELRVALDEFTAYRYVQVSPESEERNLVNHTNSSIIALAINDTGNHIVSAGEDGEVVVWDVETLEKLRIFENQGDQNLKEIRDITFSSDSDLLALASEAVDVIIINIETGEVVNELYTGEGNPMVLDFTPDGAVVAGADDGSIYIWDLPGNAIDLKAIDD
jgi:serine/threonine protein kinase